MSWDDAMVECKNLGNGWRLPNKDEIAVMYEQLHTKGKGNFRVDNFYWSSSEYNAYNAWTFSFGYGGAYSTYYSSLGKYFLLHVRAVRTLP